MFNKGFIRIDHQQGGIGVRIKESMFAPGRPSAIRLNSGREVWDLGPVEAEQLILDLRRACDTFRDLDDRRSDREMVGLVAEALRTLGHADAYGEHSGGGIWCVYVPEPAIEATEWCFGMADTMWGGGLSTADGDVWGELQRDVQLLDTS